MWDILKDFFSFLPELFIMMHTIGFEMIDLGMSISGIILIIMVLFGDVMMIFGIYTLIYKISVIIRTKEVKRKTVVGTVINKKYKAAYTTCEYNVALKMPTIRHHSEEYKVEVEYSGITKTFDCEELFKKYKEDDAISLILIQRLDKNGEIIEQKLEVSE